MNNLGSYNGTLIQYHAADDTFVNATQMCKATGKRWGHYWENQSTQEFVGALANNLQYRNSDLVISQIGGDRSGTWVHRRVAIHLAQWCSAEFAVWVSGKIDQLMTTGRVVLHNEHLEAELSTNVVAMQLLGKMDETLSEVRSQRVENKRVLDTCLETLKALQQRSPERIESEVQAELVRLEGGVMERVLGPGHRIDVLIPQKWAIEVKHWKQYKAAVGQIELYDIYLDADEEKRIHLFWKPFDKPPTEKVRCRIEKECRRKGIRVTWHKWQILVKEQKQKLLPISY